MQKITIAGKNFNLYTLNGNTSVMENTEESRTYNHGTDYFTGCDFITVNAYYIPKSEIVKAISLVENFIHFIATTIQKEQLENSEDYMESFEDFHMFHKIIENSEHDIFLTHFDGNTIQFDTDNDDIFNAFESFKVEFQKLSSFHITAGADIDDLSLEYLALGFFKDFQPEVFKNVAKSFNQDVDDSEFMDSIADFEFAEFTNKTNNQMTIQKFFIDYFSSVPTPTNSSYLEDKIFYQIIEVLK